MSSSRHLVSSIRRLASSTHRFTISTHPWPHLFVAVCHFAVSSFRYGISSFRCGVSSFRLVHSPSQRVGQPYMGSDSDLIWVQKDMLFYRKCMTSKHRAITIALFLEVLKNAYLILRELCWNRCRRHRFQLSVAHYFLAGAPLAKSLETSTGVWLIVDTSLGSLALNPGGWGRFELVSIVSSQSERWVCT